MIAIASEVPKKKKVTQKDRIKAHLLSGKSITPVECFERGWGMRLAAIIHTLRSEGMNIETKYALDSLSSVGVGETKYDVEYFVWGRINGELASFYATPKGLYQFMIDQNFTKNQMIQVQNLYAHRGIEFEKGFTIERRLKLKEERANG